MNDQVPEASRTAPATEAVGSLVERGVRPAVAGACRPVKCSWCRKMFTKGGDMACGAKVPTHMAQGPDGAWCKTDDIVMMLETT